VRNYTGQGPKLVFLCRRDLREPATHPNGLNNINGLYNFLVFVQERTQASWCDLSKIKEGINLLPLFHWLILNSAQFTDQW
jgi:hypothetical protein